MWEWWTARKCSRHGHKWFPDLGEQEFIPTQDLCLRCRAERHALPWGECLAGHPIREHYSRDGDLVAHPWCEGPR